MQINLEELDGRILLPVKAQPGSRKDELRGVQDGRLKVCVTQVAEKGKANKAIIKLLSKCLKISKSQIELVRGELNSQKTFAISGMTAGELRERLSGLLD